MKRTWREFRQREEFMEDREILKWAIRLQNEEKMVFNEMRTKARIGVLLTT